VGEALVLLRTALAAAPDYVEAHNNLGAPPWRPRVCALAACLTACARARLVREPDAPRRAAPVTPRARAQACCSGTWARCRRARARPPLPPLPNAARAGRPCPAPLLRRPAAHAQRRGSARRVDPRARRAQEAIASYERCLELAPGSRNAGQNRLLALNYILPGDDPVVCAAHMQWRAPAPQRTPPLNQDMGGAGMLR